MKLFWKLFITMMCVVTLSFAISGNILVQTAFQAMLDRETDRGIEDMKIFQYALVASLNSLPENYQATDIAVADIAESIRQNLNNSQSTAVIIYNSKNKVIYQNGSHRSDLISKTEKNTSGCWLISNKKGHYYLESLCRINSQKNYILEIQRDIDHIYQDRALLYERYLLTLGLASAVVTIILFLFSIQFTHPIRKLSQVTRSFADGNYNVRMKKRGHDEVAMLVRDFNRMAGQIEENIEQLENSARRQKEFTEAFSHELKTPLTSIIGYADMLRSMDLAKEETTMSADYIFQQGKRLERLAMKMMEFIYIDKQEIDLHKIDAVSFAENIKKMTDRLLQSKNITLIIQVEDGIFYGDGDLLLSLFSNLIDNARKACSDNGKITITGTSAAQGYSFSIQDNGAGIPEEEIHKITEPFYMVDKSRARKEGGAGMGMTLCEKIIKLHRADWDISSSPGQGTQIRITFYSEREVQP